MTLSEITRNCFQSGISAQKWLSLCQQFVAENPNQASADEVASGISNSVLFLYRSYPGDPSLNRYLTHAIKENVLPLSIFVSTFLSAARSANLHSGATLDFLCGLALRCHDESGMLAMGSLVSPSTSPLAVIEIVQDALALVRVSHTMNLNYHHRNLTHSSEALLDHLLSCVTDLGDVSLSQALVLFGNVSEILRDIQLDVAAQSALESFSISLGLIIGDDAKVAREAQMMQTMQTSKTSVLNSETDIVTLGLLWQYLVVHRAHEWGAGNTPSVTTLLVSTWRWTRWSPHVFYTQVFVSAFTCLASCPNLGDPLLWKAFIVGRLPYLLSSFHKAAGPEQSSEWRTAVKQGFKIAIRRQDLIVSGDHLIAQASGPNNGADAMNGQPQVSYVRSLLQKLVKVGLVDQGFSQEVDPLIGPSAPADAQDFQGDLTAEFDARVSQDMDSADATQWLDKIWRDANNHAAFATVALQRFEASSNGNDVEPLSRLCQLLYTHRTALDAIALHVKLSDLVFYALSFLEGYDCETVGDPQGAVSHLGNVVLFLQVVLVRYQFDEEAFTKGNRTLSTAFLRQSDEVLPIESSQTAESAAVAMWFKALFDSNEGIEDSILRSTQPKLLLRISATLFAQAIKAASTKQIDGEVLLNGVSYFTEPLLNWTLVGVIKSLIRQIRLSRKPPAVTFDILQTLVASPSCPQPVRALCSPQILRYIEEERNGTSSALNAANEKQQSSNNFDIGVIEDLIRSASSRNGNAAINSQPAGYWNHHPRNQIRNAVSMARSNKILDLDVDRCLKILDPTKFLQALWSELTTAAGSGEFELCRRVATFVLSMPRNSSTPPLLPIFMHLFLPSLLYAMDRQDPSGTAMVELTSSIIISTLTAAFHLEWSMSTVLKDNHTVLGASSSAMAKRLANDLRAKKNGRASQAVMQRLASSQSFVANFPYFAPEH
ncbi:mediator complex subunit Med5-domain-containing protein [Coprinopsis sp. MPI-PUGE-AT-0042]|nr:mediator complex subunit Med5-domain-containing protein [Coprinopsis sp. MPI-PUGE-AT-0042]